MARLEDYYTIPMDDEGPIFFFQPESATVYEGESWLAQPPERNKKVKECREGSAKAVYNPRQDPEKIGARWKEKEKSLWVKKVFRGTF